MDQSGDTERNITWTRESYAALQPFIAPGRYVNYLDDDEPGDRGRCLWPELRTATATKTKFDPSNVFHMNQNIRPA